MQHTVYLSLGTNIGDRQRNIMQAVNLLNERVGTVATLSSFLETEPWGFESANAFINIALAIKTDFTPTQLLEATQVIEKELGRTAKSTDDGYADRIIDIDILLYDDLILSQEDLKIPHPLMQERLFVLTPLAEIAPQLVHPVLKTTIKNLETRLNDNLKNTFV
ncbi:MAG: 2-amino-4-hydroxy-6-hydroxymethyldihydropteridine diphosphokinase [Tannerellaceae bacterium]